MDHRLGPWAHGLLNALVVVGLWVVVPLGLGLLRRPSGVRGAWVAGAVPAAVAVWLPWGPVPVVLCAGYVAAAGILLARVRWRSAGRQPRDLALATAPAAPPVAAAFTFRMAQGRSAGGQ